MRRILDIAAAVAAVMFVVFLIGVFRMKPLPELLLEAPKRNYRALNTPQVQEKAGEKKRSAHRKTDPQAVRRSAEQRRRSARGVLRGVGRGELPR